MTDDTKNTEPEDDGDGEDGDNALPEDLESINPDTQVPEDEEDLSPEETESA